MKKALGDSVEVDNTLASHKWWAYGSACMRGTNLVKTGDYCMQQVKLSSLNEKRENDGVFAMIDGGKAPEASNKIKKRIGTILHSELLASEERRQNDKPLLYLDHSFLTMHR